MAFWRHYRGPAAAGGAGGAGRGPSALPDRGTAPALPVPTSFFAPGNDDGPVFAHFGSYYDTLPRPRPPFTDAHVGPDDLRWSRPRYANVGARNAYQAPGTFSSTENRRVSAGPGPSSMVPASIKQVDTMTWYRWRRTDTTRYPNFGMGDERAPNVSRQARTRRDLAGPQMGPKSQNSLTRQPDTRSFGSTTPTLASPFETPTFG